MNYVKILLAIALLVPSLLSAQVLQEAPSSDSGLKDPNDFPTGIYLQLGVPGGALNYDLGFQQIHGFFDGQGIELPRLRPILAAGVGLRYKRFRAESGMSFTFGAPNSESYDNNGYLVAANQSLFSLNLGFALIQNRNRVLLLRGGFGLASNTFSIASSPGTDQVDWDLLREGELIESFPMLSHENNYVDLGLEWVLGRAKSRTSISESVRFGYRYGLNEQAWEVLGANSINAPVDRFSQIYFLVLFNVGTNYPAKKK